MRPKHLQLVRPLHEVFTDLEHQGADATFIRRARKYAAEYFCIPVGFNPRLGTVAGRASSTHIELNQELQLGCEPNEFLKTLLHELAHVMSWEFDHGHGPVWRQACRVLGIAPERCHNYATMQRRRR